MSMIQIAVPLLLKTMRVFDDDAFLHFDSDQPIFTGVSVVDNHFQRSVLRAGCRGQG